MHTPGPWSIRGQRIEHVRGDLRPGLEFALIATINEGRIGESRDNAKLIATAPELRRALKDLVSCFWDGRPKQNVKRDYHLMLRFEAAKSALAKSEPEPAPPKECHGHPAGTNGVMGETVYCDGSCRH